MVAGGRVVGGRGYCQGTALLRTVSLGRLLPKARKDDAKRERELSCAYVQLSALAVASVRTPRCEK